LGENGIDPEGSSEEDRDRRKVLLGG